MPLFGKARGSGQAEVTTPQPQFEEVSSQEFSLKLSYSAKSSEGVRLKAGQGMVARLPSMLDGYVKGESELVEPLPVAMSTATPYIARLPGQRPVAPVPPPAQPGHAPRSGRPRVGGRDRPGLRDAGLRPARW